MEKRQGQLGSRLAAEKVPPSVKRLIRPTVLSFLVHRRSRARSTLHLALSPVESRSGPLELNVASRYPPTRETRTPRQIGSARLCGPSRRRHLHRGVRVAIYRVSGRRNHTFKTSAIDPALLPFPAPGEVIRTSRRWASPSMSDHHHWKTASEVVL
jgi:hypothetical protein